MAYQHLAQPQIMQCMDLMDLAKTHLSSYLKLVVATGKTEANKLVD